MVPPDRQTPSDRYVIALEHDIGCTRLSHTAEPLSHSTVVNYCIVAFFLVLFSHTPPQLKTRVATHELILIQV